MRRCLETSNRRGLMVFSLVALLLLPSAVVRGQRDAGSEESYHLKFNQSELDIVLRDFSQKTNRTLLQGPKVPKTKITLRSQGGLTKDEYLQAVEALLAMHGIGLVKVGEKFVKVVPIAEARKESMRIGEQQFEVVLDAEGNPVTNLTGKLVQRFVGLDETDALVSQLITLKHIGIGEAKTAVDPLKHSYGQIHTFESMNSLLVTDTSSNINRIMKILQYIDQPIESREEPHIIAIKYSKASEIKSKLEELIADSQAAAKKTVAVRKSAGSPGTVKRATPAGVIRARTVPVASPAARVTEEIVAQAERGIIRGKVKIVADDRTNILIIITRPENMKYFEKIVQVLDVETSPDVVVHVIRLEFADAKEIAGMLNDLIGAAAKEEAPAGTKAPVSKGGSTALREIKKPAATVGVAGKSKIGELSKDNIKILADERTNALIIMASKSDLVTIQEIVGDMDMMLSQVLVEAVVLEVNLDDTFESGFDWLQRSIIAYNEDQFGTRSPIASFAGGGGGGSMKPSDSLAFNEIGKFPSDPLSGLTYYTTFFDLNLDMVLRLVSTDSRTKILSSPVILTTDNKDASIDVSTERYFYKGKKYVGGGDNPFYEDDVETKKVGISLNVTPRINAKKFVVMEIAQEIANVSGVQTINETDWPIVTTRKLEADIAVASGDTIVLGGLVLNQTINTESKVPLLGDIPILGRLFKSQRDEKTRNEVIVFITPYVLNTPEDMEADAHRRLEAANVEGMWKRGWSNSRLAEPNKEDIKQAALDAKEAKRRQKEMDKEARRRAAEQAKQEPEESPAVMEPEVDDFIARESRRWDKILDKVDKEIEGDIESP
ncbi:MAG: type II secretion system secretin GspD [Kiritimatiellia bacterium]|jgi:general secretion pathway protein D|nr:type II secretion system secretin GspD [Kiritimatiellia bacterium]MDP6630370.1 type II secretion system secretin GspD [Kiritimatiellia bacterium]MDP6810876.1 type II secretion system secretin GspD [Kiritimatiellia bacterium]MDP7024219.1 type II secretion system secretin GspD [Kiritimatiellia bacterium]